MIIISIVTGTTEGSPPLKKIDMAAMRTALRLARANLEILNASASGEPPATTAAEETCSTPQGAC